MKTVAVVTVDGKLGFELDRTPTRAEKGKFSEFLKHRGLHVWVTIRVFYRTEMFGDIDYFYIAVDKDAPDEIKTICLLLWGQGTTVI